jgi:hypothetical protein
VVFDLARVILTGEQRAVRIAPPPRQAFAAVTRVVDHRHPQARRPRQVRGAARCGQAAADPRTLQAGQF